MTMLAREAGVRRTPERGPAATSLGAVLAGVAPVATVLGEARHSRCGARLPAIVTRHAGAGGTRAPRPA
ncbi:hypothetical protein FMEAI12_3640033 [Parafrankia sp. Ea1.12]|nr:hypothetical protein FMEAI12_3640033 [Parafrankia sp. Ea1.12]